LRDVAQESKETCRRFSTRFESASRKLGDAWGNAKGCRANLAEAEGLTLPSPLEHQLNTSKGFRSVPWAYIFCHHTVIRRVTPESSQRMESGVSQRAHGRNNSTFAVFAGPRPGRHLDRALLAEPMSSRFCVNVRLWPSLLQQ
jgi:hypothetical protein